MNKDMQTFESAMQSLEDMLAKMTDNDVTLDESIEMYAKAAQLINICDKQLNNAKVKLEEIDAKWPRPNNNE